MTSLRDVLRRRIADGLRPTPELTPDAWGASNRIYGPGSGRPGRRDPALTAFAIDFGRAVANRQHRRVVAVFAAQSGKSETLLDVIGWKMDQRPGPILYVGPTRQFLNEQFEPRLMTLLDEAPRLRLKVARGKRMTKTRKVIAGQPLRLAHGGSSSALKSDPASLAILDEVDEMLASVKGAGNPVALVAARGTTVADFTMAVTSTPSEGPSETEHDPASGLEFWSPQDPKTVGSMVWRLWQDGSMRHWAWPCPACGVYFVPRFSCVEWPATVEVSDADGVVSTRKLTVAEIEMQAFMRCPNLACRAEIRDDPERDNLKTEMNRRGRYVAPGQTVDRDGTVHGEPRSNRTDSYWASGLCSPFRTFGERAAAYVEAARSGDAESLRVCINADLGELYAPKSGDAPAWTEVRARCLPYRSGDLPAGVLILTCGVDVQKTRLVYAVRGWGMRQESWLVEHGEVYGDTRGDQVWQDFADQVLAREWGGRLTIRRCLVDSGFRPGRPDEVPENKVYSFCRVFARTCTPCKGYATRQVPVSLNRIEVTPSGGRPAYGVELARIDSDWAKSAVHEKIRAPLDAAGGWHLPEDVTEAYCRQVVSEARVRSASGGATWVRNTRENHALDVEALNVAAAWLVGVQRLREGTTRPKPAYAAPGPAVASIPVTSSAAATGTDAPRRPMLSDIGKSQAQIRLEDQIGGPVPQW